MIIDNTTPAQEPTTATVLPAVVFTGVPVDSVQAIASAAANFFAFLSTPFGQQVGLAALADGQKIEEFLDHTFGKIVTFFGTLAAKL